MNRNNAYATGNEQRLGGNGERLKLSTLISYGMVNSGACIMFATIASLLTLFYTDYVGISPTTVATVMLVSRFKERETHGML